jgi:hypothetical protein
MRDLLRTISRVTHALDALATDLERPEPATKKHDRWAAGVVRKLAANLRTAAAEHLPPSP